MAYQSRLSRSKYQKNYSGGNPRTRFIITVVVIIFLAYAILAWILPSFIGGVSLVTGIFKPSHTSPPTAVDVTLAPPLIDIPFESTNNSNIDVKGSAAPSSKVELFMDGSLKATVTAGEDGSFDFPNVELVLGTNNVYGKTVDDQDKESLPSKTIQVTYSNQKPNLDVSSPTDGQSVQGNRQLTVSGKTDPEMQVFVNDSQIILKGDNSFETTVSLNDGDNQIKIRVVDQAGNSTEVDRKVTFQP